MNKNEKDMNISPFKHTALICIFVSVS